MLFPLICRSLSVRHGGGSCSFNGCWHRKRADAKDVILVLVRARMHVDDDIICFLKEGWPFTVFGSEDDLYLMTAKSCVRCVCVLTALDWHLLICMIWNCCGKLLKEQSFFRENDNKFVCILWSGEFSDFTANFGWILRILAPKPGGVG